MQGKAALEQLLVDVMQAVARARLDETMCAIEERLLSRPAGDLFESRPQPGGWQFHFKPMVELLLHHIKSVASNGARSPAARHAEIVKVMRLAGF